jgi:DNA gyrase subunit B
MTDADIDGSHIRTLLLTFFFRWMVEIINRGYLYFAQPPLFKIKKGKEEMYIKDEHRLDDIIMNNGLTNLRVIQQDGASISGTTLGNVIKNLLRLEKILDVFERRNMDRAVLKAFIANQVSQENLKDAQSARELMESIRDRMAERHPEIKPIEWNVIEDKETSRYSIRVVSTKNGISRYTLIDYDLIESPTFKEILSMGEKGKALGEPPLTVERDGKSTQVHWLSDLVDMIMEYGHRNVSIQRYKGLGEMNAEQLWDTTMNPENRRLLQVTIEDAVKANEIFSILMGDQVEPRRDFIERNALNVENLDY